MGLANASNVFIFMFNYLCCYRLWGIVRVFLLVRVDATSILAVFWFPYGGGSQRCARAAALALVLFSAVLS